MRNRLLNVAAAAFAAMFFVQAGPRPVVVTGPYLRFVATGAPAAGYFHIINNAAEPAVLVGVQSSDCRALMMHRSTNVGGMARMEMVESVTVLHGQRVVFEPGGYHLMCLSPSSSLRVGGTAKITFKFRGGPTLEVAFPVVDARGGR